MPSRGLLARSVPAERCDRCPLGNKQWIKQCCAAPHASGRDVICIETARARVSTLVSGIYTRPCPTSTLGAALLIHHATIWRARRKLPRVAPASAWPRGPSSSLRTPRPFKAVDAVPRGLGLRGLSWHLVPRPGPRALRCSGRDTGGRCRKGSSDPGDTTRADAQRRNHAYRHRDEHALQPRPWGGGRPWHTRTIA